MKVKLAVSGTISTGLCVRGSYVESCHVPLYVCDAFGCAWQPEHVLPNNQWSGGIYAICTPVSGSGAVSSTVTLISRAFAIEHMRKTSRNEGDGGITRKETVRRGATVIGRPFRQLHGGSRRESTGKGLSFVSTKAKKDRSYSRHTARAGFPGSVTSYELQLARTATAITQRSSH